MDTKEFDELVDRWGKAHDRMLGQMIGLPMMACAIATAAQIVSARKDLTPDEKKGLAIDNLKQYGDDLKVNIPETSEFVDNFISGLEKS